jgi:predicted nucleic acid-binding protein
LEKGSDLIDHFFLEADSVVVGSICFPEILSALSRLRREKRLNNHQYDQCKKALIADFELFEVCQLSPEVLERSVIVLEHTQLRAMDALHVASAIEAKASRFVSSDIRQAAAAKKFNLTVDLV